MIIYLHGFNSSGNSRTVKELRKHLPFKILAPSYPSNDPDKAIQIIEEHIRGYCSSEDMENLMFIGSSMGGYFAQYLGRKYSAKVVLINPALKLTDVLLKFIGINENFNTHDKYLLTEEDIQKFEKYNVSSYVHSFGTVVLLDEDDDVVDPNIAIEAYKDKAHIVVYPKGSHRFEHVEEASQEIINYYYTIWGG